MDKQLKLKDYATIGDCRTAAIISKYGSIDFLCLPDFSSPFIFGRMLDAEKGGHFSVTLKDIVHISRRYLPNTAILETTMESKTGSIRLTDCMPVISDARHQKNLQPLREVLRRVEVISGAPTLQVELCAKPDYAKKIAHFNKRGNMGWAMCYQHYLLNILANVPLEMHNDMLSCEFTAKAGERFYLSLTFERASPGVIVPIGEQSDTRIAETQQWWETWCGTISYKGDYRETIIRSAITLRMLTFTLSGALIAAVTTSLPEKPQGWMNWDYRYSWPRDSAVALAAFMNIGLKDEADAYFDWLMLAANNTRPLIANMYDIYGRWRIGETLLPWLSGYQGAKPVRIGNMVSKQLQHDVYGEVLMAIENWTNHFGPLSAAESRLIEGLGKAVSKFWREPDNGIWEIRGERHHYTHSKVMAWYVFDTLVKLHAKGYVDGPLALYESEREVLKEVIEREGFNAERNCFTAIFGGNTVDASLLLLPRCGFIDYNDPRMIGTWEAIISDLEHNGLLLRYPLGFAGSQPGEGALMICNFWAVGYLAGAGKADEAKARLDYLLSLANELGLYSEAVDVKTKEALGNMPQSFSHASLILAVLRVEQSLQQTRKAA